MLLGGCNMFPQKQEVSDGKQKFSVYYTNADHTQLKSLSYEPQSETFEDILNELLKQFSTSVETEYVSVLPDTVKIKSYTIGVDSLTIDFSGNYIGLSNVDEILLRSGIVKTLIQLPGIYSVSLTVDGQALTEESTGYVVGPMRDETFVDSQGDSINSYQYVDLILYFPDYLGSKLAPEESEAFYSSNLLLERVIVEHILKGPQTPGLSAIAVPGVQVNSVTTEDGICVIDLDESFNQANGLVASPEMCLYAIVNTLSRACSLEGVVFRINGSGDIRFRDEIPLDQTFVEDLTMIRHSSGNEGADAGKDVSRPANQNEDAEQPADQDKTAVQPADQGGAAAQSADQDGAAAQPADQEADVAQPANQDASASQPANQEAAASQADAPDAGMRSVVSTTASSAGLPEVLPLPMEENETS